MFWNEPFFRRASLPGFDSVSRLQDVLAQVWPGAAHAGNAGGDLATAQPAMNVWRQPDRVQVALQLPGVAAEQVELVVEHDWLTIRGRREIEAAAPAPATAAPEAAAPQWARRERRLGRFERQVQLPFPVETAAVRAEVKQGLLWIDLPRAAADKPRKIEVRTPAE